MSYRTETGGVSLPTVTNHYPLERIDDTRGKRIKLEEEIVYRDTPFSLPGGVVEGRNRRIRRQRRQIKKFNCTTAMGSPKRPR